MSTRPIRALVVALLPASRRRLRPPTRSTTSRARSCRTRRTRSASRPRSCSASSTTGAPCPRSCRRCTTRTRRCAAWPRPRSDASATSRRPTRSWSASTSDSSEFVRSQAKKALELVAGGGGGPWWPRRPKRARASTWRSTSRAAARAAPSTGGWCARRSAKELQKLPTVTLSVAGGGGAAVAVGAGVEAPDRLRRRRHHPAAVGDAGGRTADHRLRLEGVRRHLPRALDQDDDARGRVAADRLRRRPRRQSASATAWSRRSKPCATTWTSFCGRSNRKEAGPWLKATNAAYATTCSTRAISCASPASSSSSRRS